LVRSTDFFNPYADWPVRSLDLVRRNWQTPAGIFALADWSEATRSGVHELLRQSGELILRVPAALRGTLKAALIDLQTTPVEVGPIWCFPEVLAVQDQGSTKDARVVLRETW
jgi:hypothetical protein